MEKLNQLKTIPANELHEDVRLPKMVQKNNNMSTLSLPDEKYTAEKVISSEADETQDATLTFSYREDNLSRISLSSQFSAPISRLRKKLLVLDLNGLLADIVSPPPKDCKADKKIARHAVFKRPFCHDFLRFCFERFDVGVWSSRTQKNVERVVDFLMGDMKHKLLFCWDLSYCTATSFKALENKYKALVFKELRKVWEISDPNCPWAKGDYNESNTVLLDDSPYKALLNPPYTAIFPCSYKYQNPSDNSLGAGGDVRVYLEMLAEAENVQRFIQHNPFGQGAITNRSEYWDFYLRAMNTIYFAN
ncbi:ubiquitin-like domain-containing CTD phosphatase 1 isoform X1 [Citrus clementina]|nr:ubiquitin-like domain-containing CTD phosphatase 1 isoform X1 [Citrus x clementina]XP_024037874.1 ubiquitin-like domain-containing CTD phosphatase 1 isoform X1 [Citrus x clementina]XP_024037875.1 ubiquitin-like domain-containing CTD phosphatase 1 isoform X1 [Citrus x clementina]XP_024037876.1 ubiquitin-like domain-containing CTD phosphatase 1 isoform X1 [Citrus x clementina]XP_024037877.1 ubiquitin-like domain-containing CTD phosphatase 1 isoform X1 [Citrus x clementina]